MAARRRHTVAVATLLWLASIGSDLHAEPATKADALRLFAEARQAMAQEDFVTAKEKLMASQRLLAGAGTLINLGYCQERLGFLPQAHRAYRSALVLAEQNGQKDRVAAAHERLRALSKNIALVTVKVDAPDLTVAFDGEVVDPREPIPLEEGKHVVRAKTPSGETWQATIVAVKGETPTIVIPLAPKQVAKPPAPRPLGDAEPKSAPAIVEPVAADVPPDKPTTPLGTQRLIGLGAMGLGVIGFGVGAFLGLKAQSTYEDADAQCNDRVCTAKGVELTDSALSAATWSTVAFGVGAVAAGAGAVLFLTAKKPGPSAARSGGPTVRVHVAPIPLMVFEAPL